MRKWSTTPLGDLCELINGRAFKPADWGKSGLPIVRIQNLNDQAKPFNHFDGDYRDVHYIDDGQILLSWSGTPGTSFGCFRWQRGPALLNQHIFKVLPDSGSIDGDFFIYAVNSKLDEMIRQAHGGVGLRHITKSKLQAIHLPVPDLDEQRRIVTRIKECLERVEAIDGLRRETIAEADAVLPSMLNEAFIGLTESYEEVAISDVAAETRYGTSQKCTTVPEGTAILRIPNVAEGFINFKALKYRRLEDRELTRLELQHGDLLFVRTNGSRDLVGRCAIFEGDGNGTSYAFASYLIRVRLDQSRMRPHYLAFFLNSTHGRAEIDQRRRTSAGQYNINSENLRNIKLPLPPIEMQDQLIEALADRQAAVIDLQRELANARAESEYLRESVLRRAFAGEL